MQGDCVGPYGHYAAGEVFTYMVGDPPPANGRMVVHDITGRKITLPGWWPAAYDAQPNTIMYGWATLVAKLLQNAGSLDGKSYHVGGMYIEYEVNGGAVVSPPAFDRSGGISYYQGLSSSATRDYLRVPLTAAVLSSTDETRYPDGNQITFFAQTQGTVGVNGLAFNDSVQSRVYGGALVAFPDSSDSSQDVVMSRFYYSNSDNQLIKAAGSQIGLEWPVTFK